MAFESKAELREQRDNLVALVDELREQNLDLNTRVHSSVLAEQIYKELRAPESQALLTEQALVVARMAVFKAEEDRIRAEIAERLKKEKGAEFALSFQAYQAAEIRSNLDEVFRNDGTYDKIEAEVKLEEKRKIAEDLRKETRDAVVQELSDPAKRQLLIEDAVREYRASGDDLELAQAIRSGIEAEWSDEVLTEVKQQIEAEERAREEGFKAAKRIELEGSQKIKKFRSNVRDELEVVWADESLEGLRNAVRDDEQRKVVEKRIEQEAETAKVKDDEKRRKELSLKFKGLGLDAKEISSGSTLIVYLGSIQKIEVNKQVLDQWKQRVNKKVKVDGVACERRLEFVSHGDGKFTLQTDSLHESNSVYEKQAAIKPGTIVSLGQQIIANGQPKFDPSISAGRELYIDFDDKDPHTDSTHLAVCELEIDKTYLRDELETIKLMYK